MLQGFDRANAAGDAYVDTYEVTSGRNLVWPYVIEKIQERPTWGFGREAMSRVGLVQFLWAHYRESFPHPHNAYLEMLLDNGLVGFAIVIPFYLVVLFHSIRLFLDKRSPLSSAAGGVAAALVLALLVASMGSQTFYPREGAVGMWAAIGLMLRVCLERAHVPRTGSRMVLAPPAPALWSAGSPDAGGTVMTRLVYLLAASHSGSTLLCMMLAGHPDVCTAGELKATCLGDPDRYLCSCGRRIRLCPFWHQVREAMKQRGIDFEVTRSGTDFHAIPSRYAGRLLRPLHRDPLLETIRDAGLALSPAWRAALPRIQATNAALAQTLCDLCGAEVVVDSSKIALRLKYLLRNPHLDVKVIRLLRDGRGVATTHLDPALYADAAESTLRGGGYGASRLGEQKSIRDAADEWRRSNEEAEHLLARLDPSRWTQVRYEDLCCDPEGTLAKLHRFIGVDPAAAFREFRALPRHVIGNGMRLDRTATIRLDERWKSVLRPGDLAVFDSLAGEMNRRYGYKEPK